MILEPGERIDRYTLVAPLGEGGQGQVWRAIDPLAPGQSVALKLLSLDDASAADLERARREAHHLARLAHPTLPACHALFEDLRHHLLGLVLDLVEGTPLDAAVDDPRFSPPLALLVARRVAEALAYLHAEGLVHRDVKPDNILLTETFWQSPEDPYSIKLIDLGISVHRGNPRPLTVVGRLIGTPPFMPPEQIDPSFWRASDDTPAADVFALGVVAWWMLHRAHPTGLSLQESLPAFARAYRATQQKGSPWPPPSPTGWDAFFQRSLALALPARAPTAADLIPLLAPRAASEPPRSSLASAPPRASALATPPLAPPPTGPSLASPTGPSFASSTGPSLASLTGPSLAAPLATGASLAPAVASPNEAVVARTHPSFVPLTGPSLAEASSRLAPDEARVIPATPPLPAAASPGTALMLEPAHPPRERMPRTVDDLDPVLPTPRASAPLALPDEPSPSPLFNRRALLLGVILGALLMLLLMLMLIPRLRRPLRRLDPDRAHPRLSHSGGPRAAPPASNAAPPAASP